MESGGGACMVCARTIPGNKIKAMDAALNPTCISDYRTI